MHASRRRALRTRLEALVAAPDRLERRADDPVSIVHRFARDDDREVVGLVAATLAFGNVVAVRRSIERVLVALGPEPAATLEQLSESELARRLSTFRHRVYGGADVARMLSNAGALRREHGSLGAAFATLSVGAETPTEALARLADVLRGDALGRPGLAHLVPDPRKGSASKRLWLYLRWMIRPDDGIDLGLWDVPASSLLIPVDTHVLRIGRNLGLTSRTDASARTAAEITDALRELDADDPVRYDFAICHLGVSRACPSRRVDATCRGCSLRDVCLAFRGELDQSRRKGASLASSRRRVSRPSS